VILQKEADVLGIHAQALVCAELDVGSKNVEGKKNGKKKRMQIRKNEKWEMQKAS